MSLFDRLLDDVEHFPEDQAAAVVAEEHHSAPAMPVVAPAPAPPPVGPPILHTALPPMPASVSGPHAYRSAGSAVTTVVGIGRVDGAIWHTPTSEIHIPSLGLTILGGISLVPHSAVPAGIPVSDAPRPTPGTEVAEVLVAGCQSTTPGLSRKGIWQDMWDPYVLTFSPDGRLLLREAVYSRHSAHEQESDVDLAGVTRPIRATVTWTEWGTTPPRPGGTR